MNLFLDIETLPALDPAVRAEIDVKHFVSDDIGEIKAAGNLADPAKIAADIEKRTAKAVADLAERKAAGLASAEEEWRRTALDAGKGHVLSIAFAFGDGPVDCRILTGPDTAEPADEAHLLRQFFEAVDPFYNLPDTGGAACVLNDDDAHRIVESLLQCPMSPVMPLPAGYEIHRKPNPRVVAHHADFDVRFLWQRAAILGVKVPFWWPINEPTWKRERVFCTMAAWAGAGGRIGLDRLCKALGVPGKEGFDGKDIWDAVKAGRIAEIIDYNVGDIHRLRGCFRKLNFLPPAAEVAA